jgi:signal transduction histidine kinase
VALETIAHELRQPLSAIESIAYYLNLVLPQDGSPGRAQAARLQELVEQSNWILTCALQLADPSPLATELLDLDKLITDVTARLLRATTTFRLELAADCRWCVSIPGDAIFWKSADAIPAGVEPSLSISPHHFPEEKGWLKVATATPGSDRKLPDGCGLGSGATPH